MDDENHRRVTVDGFVLEYRGVMRYDDEPDQERKSAIPCVCGF